MLDVADLRSAMRTRLRRYPRGGDLRVRAAEFLIKEPRKEGWIELFARIPNAPRLHEDMEGWHATADALLDDIVPRGPVPGAFRYLRVPVGGVVLHPLMAWWIPLHGLSMLARYHPALLQQALDVDFSPDAVVLEAALEAAIDDVPDRVSAALNREVPPPIMDASDRAPGNPTADAEVGPSAP